MVYRVYTDAATNLQEGYSCVAFLVLKGNTYLKSFYEYRDVKSTAVAESLAVGLALRYIVDEVGVTEEDEVNIFCDSLYTVKFARKCLNLKKNNILDDDTFIKPNKATWLEDIYIYILEMKAQLTLTKKKAHSRGKNPHCYVDRLAKMGLNNSK